MSLRSYLQLARAPNVFTAVTNVFTGCAAAAGPHAQPTTVALLALSSACLYTGGIVLNDYCDLEPDRVERPTRPLPSGAVSPRVALALAIGLLAAGIALAATVNIMALMTASAIALLIATYDVRFKSVPVLGPINMAACRFGNVLLGACAAPACSVHALPFATAMAAWVAVISLISRREAARPQLQAIVKAMVLAIPLLDGLFVGLLTTPALGLAVAAFALPAWLIARWLYVT
ncbi:MAG: UbiA family prenyltransferase [Verrucomicrobia bacterium]|nr:UbiA family prenyltransferase [Verrucomicrobiota bacterium]